MLSKKMPTVRDSFMEFGNDMSDNNNSVEEDLCVRRRILKNKIEFNEAIIQERNEEIEQIFKDVQDINEIFRDLNKLVLEQSEPIIVLEENIDSSVKSTEKGVDALKIAESYHKSWFSKRNKFILMGIAGLSINAPVTILFGLKAGVISGLSTIGLSVLSTIFTKN